ncbi:MAG: CopD family protein, partial [Terriglobales bacterium]
VGAALVWLGGLVVLLIVMLSRTRAAALGPVLDLWSRWALWAVAVLGLTGATQALLRLDRLGDLWQTHYGRLLLWKTAGLVLAVAAAAGSRYWLRRRAVDRQRSMTWLRRTIAAEVGLVAVVLAVTVVLVGTAPPQGRAHAGRPPDFYSVTVTSGRLVLQIEVDPARVGNNSVHLTAFTPAGAPLNVQQWDVTTALPARSIGPVTVPLLPISANHVVGEAALSLSGTWQLNVAVRTSDVDQVTVTRNFEVT